MGLPKCKVMCSYKQLMPISDIKKCFDPKNRNIHPKDQIERLAKILEYQGARYCAKISNQSGILRSGHGRVMAAELAGWTHYPVDFQDYESLDQEYADAIADNAVASWAELDLSGINFDLAELGPDINLDMLGIKDFFLDPSERDLSDEEKEELYTKKIQAPIYEPKGERPDLNELFDRSKSRTLEAEIETSGVDENIKTFLLFAAQRHVVFDYEKIAEYYAHAPKDIQSLMEKSALVIIDFNKAIENGFIQMTKEISEVYPNGSAD